MKVTTRRLGDDVERIVILKRGPGGIRQVADTGDDERVLVDDENVRARIIRRGRSGVLEIDEVFRTRRKKQSRLLKPVEKTLRKGTARNVRRLQRYLELHERSNRKKKNGWVRDYPRNAVKALRRKGL